MSERVTIFLHASDYCAGAERSLCDLAAGLQARGRPVEVWNAGENPELASWLAERGVVLRSLPAPDFGRRDLAGFLRHGLVLTGRWLRRRPRLVHANNLSSTKYAAAFAALLRVPLIGHWRDGPPLDGLTRFLLGRCRAVVAISRFVAEGIGEVPGTTVKVIHNAIDVAGVSAAPPAFEVGEILQLVTPAAFRPDKRLELALRAAARLRDEGLAFRWRICGPRPLPDYLSAIEAEHQCLGLAGLVSLEESLPLEAVYSGAHAVVSSSGDEPFGRTIIEAQARGLPAVGFDSGALPELIEPGVTGLLARDGDARSLAEALLDLASDPARMSAMGSAARRSVEDRFALERLLDEVEALHDSIT